MRATTAVIPAAGLGTRFLPATKAIAKEMLPVVDKPAIQYVVEEAVRAGLDDLLLVTSSGKAALEDHFDQDPTLERQLEEAGKLDLLAVAQATSRLAQVAAVRQGAPKGLGHAVGCARRHVGDQPFAVLACPTTSSAPRSSCSPTWSRSRRRRAAPSSLSWSSARTHSTPTA